MKSLILLSIALLFLGCTREEKTDVASPIPHDTITPATVAAAPAVPPPTQLSARCEKAFEEIPKFDARQKMFSTLFSFYQKYNDCIENGISEGMQFVTVKTLDKKWNEITDFAKLSEHDPKFKSFILSNINSFITGLDKEVKNIEKRSRQNCPKDQKDICNEINEAAKKALGNTK